MNLHGVSLYPPRIETGPGWTIVQADATSPAHGLARYHGIHHVITDPPYSQRTHVGHDTVAGRPSRDGARRSSLGYAFLAPEDVARIAPLLSRKAPGWLVVCSDHVLIPAWEAALAERYVFPPLPYVAPGSRVRINGDGPSSWTIHLLVSRTARLSRWGTLPGAYIREAGWDKPVHKGGKPVALMQCLVRDYSRVGELVCDPFMGSGSTGVACIREGRSFLGFEFDAKAFAFAHSRLRGARPQRDFDFMTQPRPDYKQQRLV